MRLGMSEIDPDEERKTMSVGDVEQCFHAYMNLFCIIGAINVISTNFKVMEAIACLLA